MRLIEELEVRWKGLPRSLSLCHPPSLLVELTVSEAEYTKRREVPQDEERDFRSRFRQRVQPVSQRGQTAGPSGGIHAPASGSSGGTIRPKNKTKQQMQSWYTDSNDIGGG